MFKVAVSIGHRYFCALTPDFIREIKVIFLWHFSPGNGCGLVCLGNL